jgi:hypothetical protein
MTKEQLLGIVRHSLTFFGGILLTYGMINEIMLSELIGSGISLASVIWSIVNKKPIMVEKVIETTKPAKKKRYYPKKKKEAAK